MTLKGDKLTPEFKARLNKAAKKAGQRQADFAVEAREAAIQRVLSSSPPAHPPESPPDGVILSPRESPALVRKLEERQEATEKSLSEAAQNIADLARQVQSLTELQRRSFWEWLRGTMRGTK